MKRNSLLICVVSVLVLTCFSNSAFADVIQQKDTVTGIVIDKKKQPLPGAKVEIMGQPYSAYTDFDGRFNIKCEPGAKKVRVTYPKLKAAKKKIKPDMTVQIGRSWKQVPEHYQWFVGANIGVGMTSTELYYEPARFGWYADYAGPNISIMAGRVKAVGWYLKYFISPYVKPSYTEVYFESEPIPGFNLYDSKAYNTGLLLGGIVRLGCPLHLYLGGGFAYCNINNINLSVHYQHYGWQIDMGLLFRIKENFGINWSWNLGQNDGNGDISLGTFSCLGVSYFFNK